MGRDLESPKILGHYGKKATPADASAAFCE
jgi:hypothetical protein